MLKTRFEPLTRALTPVADLSPFTAVAIALIVVPLAKESCSVPSVPATCTVTPAAPTVPPA